MNEPSARDSGLRRVSLVTKWTAAAGAALMAAFAVYAASANPGRSNPTSGATTLQAPVSRHTTTGGS